MHGRLANDKTSRGDSLTVNLQSKYPQTWDEWFGQYDAAPLGVSASTVEELAWRIMSGRERFDVGPKVRHIIEWKGPVVASTCVQRQHYRWETLVQTGCSRAVCIAGAGLASASTCVDAAPSVIGHAAPPLCR